MSGVEGQAAAAAEDVAPATAPAPTTAAPLASTPFTKAMISISRTIKVPLRDYALAYLRHHDVLHELSDSDDGARRLAVQVMAEALNAMPFKVRLALAQFRKTYYHCMVEFLISAGSQPGSSVLQRAPHWVQLLEKKLNMMPRAQEEASLRQKRRLKKASKLTPGGALRLMVAYCQRHHTLCSSTLYSELRQALRCGSGPSELHAVWVSAQRVCTRQLAALCRAGDVPDRDPRQPLAPLSPAAWRVADLVLTYTDVNTYRILNDESVTLYEELQALTTLFTLVQKHRAEPLVKLHREVLARRWTQVYREYTAGGKVTSLVVLQRRWLELKLQTRARLAQYFRDERTLPPAALLHVDIARRYPHVVRGEAPNWRRMVAEGLVVQEPLEDKPAPSQEEDEDPAGDAERADTQPQPQSQSQPQPQPQSQPQSQPQPQPQSQPQSQPHHTPPHDNQDDDVLLIEKQVETIDVDSASDTEDVNTTDNSIPRKRKSNAPIQEKEYKEITVSLNQIIVPTVLKQIINVASVETINNRFQESINWQSICNIQTNVADDGAAPSTSVAKNIDADQTLARLQSLDPTKVSSQIVFESDSDDDTLDKQPSDADNKDLNTNEFQIVISNVTSKADMVKNIIDDNSIQFPNTGSDAVTQSEDGTSDVTQVNTPNSHSGNITIENGDSKLNLQQDEYDITKPNDAIKSISHTGKGTISRNGTSTSQINSSDGTISSTNNNVVNIADKPKSESEGVITQDIADNNDSRDTTSVIAANSGPGNDTAIAMDIDSNSMTIDTLVDITNSESGNVTIEPSNTKSQNGIPDLDVTGGDSNSNNNGIVSIACDSEDNEGYGDDIDLKLFMETRVNLVRIHDTAVWSRHSRHDRYIDVTHVDAAALRPPADNTDNVAIQIKVNDINKTINIEYSDIVPTDTKLEPTRHEDGDMATDSSDSAQVSDEDSDTSATDTVSEDDIFEPVDDSDESATTSGGGSSGRETDSAHSKGTRGNKCSASVLEWCSGYDAVYGGRGRGEGERVAKKVELPDIEEVRRVNSNILTAQVAPITAADGVSETAKRAGDKPVEPIEPVEPAEPVEPVEPVEPPVSAITGEPIFAPHRGPGDREWPDGVVPTRMELNHVLNKLASELRRRGLVCGVPAPAYCCAARRQRSVNDARRRICARAPEIQLHVHGAGGCDCCCRHLLQGAEQRAQLDSDVSRLRRDLRRLLKAGHADTATPTSNGSQHKQSIKKTSKKDGNSKNTKTSSSKVKEKKAKPEKKAQEVVQAVAEPTAADPLAEWERQKTLNAQYFHIQPNTNRKRRRDANKKDSDTRPAPTRPIPMQTNVIELQKNAESNSYIIDITDDSNDSDRLQVVETEPTQGELPEHSSSEGSPNKVRKVMETQKPFSLVVTDLKGPQHPYKRMVKIQKNCSPMVNPASVVSVLNTMSQAGGSIVTVPSQLATVPSSAGTKLVTVPSSVGAKLVTVPSSMAPKLVSVPSSVATKLVSVPSSMATKLVTVPSSMAPKSVSDTSSVATKLVSVPSSMATKLVTVQSSMAPKSVSVPSSVATKLVSVPSSMATKLVTVPSSMAPKSVSVPSSVATKLVTVPSSVDSKLVSVSSCRASFTAIPGNLVLPGNAVNISNASSGLINLLNNTTLVSSVPGVLVSVPRSSTDVNTSAGTLVSLLNNTGSVSTLQNTLMCVPGSAPIVTTPVGELVNLLSTANSVSAVSGTLISVPHGVTDLGTSGSNLVNLLRNTASVDAVTGPLMSVPSSATRVTVAGGNLVNLLNNKASVSTVPASLKYVPITATRVTVSAGKSVSSPAKAAGFNAAVGKLLGVPSAVTRVTSSAGKSASSPGKTASVGVVPSASMVSNGATRVTTPIKKSMNPTVNVASPMPPT